MYAGTVAALVGVGALVFAVGAVAIADPGGAGGQAPAVSAATSPDALVEAALVQPRSRDYTVTIRSTYSGPRDIVTQDYRLRVEATAREMRIDGLDRPFVGYANAHRRWVARTADPGPSGWTADGAGWDGSPVLTPIDRDIDPTLVRSNATAAVVRLTDTRAVHRLAFGDTELAPGANVSARLTVDRRVGAPRRLVVETRTPADDPDTQSERRRTVFRFEAWDETTVDRPATIPYSLDELVRDASELGGRW